MKKFQLIIITTIFISVSLQSNAQKNTVRYSLSGTITASSGSPLPAASVYIPDLKKGGITDENGNYTIGNIPAGTYLAEIKYIGYKTILQNIDFNKNKTQNFSMAISVTEENEIVITGSSKATSIKRNPVPIISINKQLDRKSVV